MNDAEQTSTNQTTANRTTRVAPRPLPEAEPRKGLRILAGLARTRNPLTALALMREYVG